jgi:ubiquinone/menaquinone biosynthesis C-methylase UbiE
MAMRLSGGNELVDAMHFLEREVKLRTGMRVIELGAGSSGHFIFPAAHLIGPEGKIYAVDILPSAISSLKSRARLEGVTNVHLIHADIEHSSGMTRVASGSMDVVLLCNILFQVKERALVMREAARMVKPGGVVAVIEWKTAGAAFGPRGAVRLDLDDVEAYATAAALKRRHAFEAGPYHYGCTFVK